MLHPLGKKGHFEGKLSKQGVSSESKEVAQGGTNRFHAEDKQGTQLG